MGIAVIKKVTNQFLTELGQVVYKVTSYLVLVIGDIAIVLDSVSEFFIVL